MSQFSCLSIGSDEYGFYWVGTEDGLNRIGGNEVKVFKRSDKRNPISSNHILALSVFKKDFVFISTKGGLDLYNYENNGIQNNLIENEIFTDLLNVRDSVIFGSTESGKIFQLGVDRKGEITYQPVLSKKTTINCLDFDFKTKELCYGYLGGAALVNLSNRQETEILLQNIDENNVNVIDIQKYKNDIFLACDADGLYQFNKFLNPGRKLKIGGYKNVSKLDVYGPYLWVGGKGLTMQLETRSDGMYRINPLALADESQLVMSFHESKDGKFLFGTYGSGLHILGNNRFNHVSSKKSQGEMQSEAIWGFWRDTSGSVIVNGDQGLDLITPYNQGERSQEKILYGHSFKGYDVIDFLETEGDYWLPTFKSGLFRVNKATGQKIHYDKFNANLSKRIHSNKLRKVFLDSKNRLWIGSFGDGLCLLDLNENRIIRFNPEQYRNLPKYIFDFYEDNNGEILIGCYQGIVKYTNGHFQPVPLKWKRRIDFIFDFNRINKSKIWISTSDGVHLIDADDQSILKSYSEDEGLKSSHIYGSVMDKNGDIWCSSNNGLARINTSTNQISIFSDKDGLQSQEFNGTAFNVIDEIIYFGGVNGLNYFHPDSIKFESKESMIFMNQFYVDFQPFYLEDTLAGRHVNFIDNIVLDYQSNTISFDFYVPSDKGNYSYEYMLEGADTDWIVANKGTFISYRNLASGTYTLKLRAIDLKTHEYVPTKILKITIETPFWRKWWFILLCVLIVIATIVLIINKRVTRNKRVQAMLQDLVGERTAELESSLKEKEILFQEVHHRVKNNLQLISSLLNLQSHFITDEKAIQAFDKSKSRIRSMALVHTKLYQNKELQHLHIEDYIQELFTDVESSYRGGSEPVRLVLNAENIDVYVETSVKLGLILTEIMINAFKYAFVNNEYGVLKISLKPRDNGYLLVVQDNGPGFQKAPSSDDSLGQEIIEGLTEQLNGSIKQYNDEGAVTEIYFEDVAR